MFPIVQTHVHTNLGNILGAALCVYHPPLQVVHHTWVWKSEAHIDRPDRTCIPKPDVHNPPMHTTHPYHSRYTLPQPCIPHVHTPILLTYIYTCTHCHLHWQGVLFFSSPTHWDMTFLCLKQDNKRSVATARLHCTRLWRAACA
jgi:hypothetical protein